MSDEPLAVLVAKALGWTDVTWDETGAWGRPPGMVSLQQVPRYGMDTPDGWAATGPLATQFKMDLYSGRNGSPCSARSEMDFLHAEADSLTEAIARLGVMLHELDKPA